MRIKVQDGFEFGTTLQDIVVPEGLRSKLSSGVDYIDSALGGDDYDEMLAQWLLSQAHALATTPQDKTVLKAAARQAKTKSNTETHITGRAPKRSTTKPAVACPTPETTKNTVDKSPSSEKDQPNSFMNTGNMTGKSRCEKCELAWARPTKPMTEASDLNDSEGEETAAVFMGIGRQKASSLASDHTIKPARLLACCGQRRI